MLVLEPNIFIFYLNKMLFYGIKCLTFLMNFYFLTELHDLFIVVQILGRRPEEKH